MLVQAVALIMAVSVVVVVVMAARYLIHAHHIIQNVLVLVLHKKLSLLYILQFPHQNPLHDLPFKVRRALHLFQQNVQTLQMPFALDSAQLAMMLIAVIKKLDTNGLKTMAAIKLQNQLVPPLRITNVALCAQRVMITTVACSKMVTLGTIIGAVIQRIYEAI